MGNTSDQIEIRKVKNGFVVMVNNDAEYAEYVFAKEGQVIRFMKDYFKSEE